MDDSKRVTQVKAVSAALLAGLLVTGGETLPRQFMPRRPARRPSR